MQGLLLLMGHGHLDPVVPLALDVELTSAVGLLLLLLLAFLLLLPFSFRPLALGCLAAVGPNAGGAGLLGNLAVLDDHAHLDLHLNRLGRERIVQLHQSSHHLLICHGILGVHRRRMLADVIESREVATAMAGEGLVASVLAVVVQYDLGRHERVCRSAQGYKKREREAGLRTS